MSKNKPVLKLSKKTSLKVEAKNGIDTFTFFVEIPHWNYVDKKKKEAEYMQITKVIGKQMKSVIEETENLSQISTDTFENILKKLADPSYLEPMKQWFLANIQAIDGLVLEKIDLDASEEETITRLTKDSEWFAGIFSEIWTFDENIAALTESFNAFFKGETI